MRCPDGSCNQGRKPRHAVSFGAVFQAALAVTRWEGGFDPDRCPACGRNGVRITGGLLRCEDPATGLSCGFIGGPITWVMAGGLGPAFTTRAQARAAIEALFDEAGWTADWGERS